jgi:GH18 family chitinase
MSVSEVRSRFFPRLQVCMSIGNPGDTDGFSKGAATSDTRELFARNVAATVERLGYDCVGEYPTTAQKSHGRLY